MIIGNYLQFKQDCSVYTLKKSRPEKINFCPASDMFVKSSAIKPGLSFEGKPSLKEAMEFTKFMRKRIYSKKQVIKIEDQFPAAEGIFWGRGLPEVWMSKIKDLNNFDIEEFLESMGKIFTDDRHFCNVDVLCKNISGLFKRVGIASENDLVKVEYLDKGNWGRGHCISINGTDRIAAKEYKRTFRYSNNHGNHSEQNVAEYIQEYAGDETDMVKYYYGDSKNGYMICDYISSSSPHPKKNVILSELGVAYTDKARKNIKNNTILDYGGMVTISNLVGNKTAQEVHRIFKYMLDDAAKLKLFNEILSDTSNKSFRDNLIGLTHSVKYMPLKEQENLYRRLYSIDNLDVNIALVENIKHFNYSLKLDDMLEGLCKKPEKKMKEVIAREIKDFPEDMKNKLFESLSTYPSQKLKKYLARNLNYYYQDFENRVNIYDNLCEGAEMYANIALAHELHLLKIEQAEERFARLFNKGDLIVDCALARNIEIFKDDPALMLSWVNKLLDTEDYRVSRAVAESVGFLDDSIKAQTFERLLDVKDMNTKEFLAENITFVPYFYCKKDWVPRILDGADNSVRRALALNLQNLKEKYLRAQWKELILENADSSVRKIIEANS